MEARDRDQAVLASLEANGDAALEVVSRLTLKSVAHIKSCNYIWLLDVWGVKMSKAEKLIDKFRNASGTFPWKDLVAMLKLLGFESQEGSGSRIKFIRGRLVISLHKPHPQNEVKSYAVKQVKETLKSEGLI